VIGIIIATSKNPNFSRKQPRPKTIESGRGNTKDEEKAPGNATKKSKEHKFSLSTRSDDNQVASSSRNTRANNLFTNEYSENP
jgi:hypothetical protein